MYKSLKRQLSQKVLKERADFILGGGTPQVWAKRVPDGVELMEIYRFILTAGQTAAKAARQILRAIKESDSKRRGSSTEELWPELTKTLRWFEETNPEPCNVPIHEGNFLLH